MIENQSDDEEFLGGAGVGPGESTRLGSSQRGKRHLNGSAGSDNSASVGRLGSSPAFRGSIVNKVPMPPPFLTPSTPKLKAPSSLPPRPFVAIAPEEKTISATMHDDKALVLDPLAILNAIPALQLVSQPTAKEKASSHYASNHPFLPYGAGTVVGYLPTTTIASSPSKASGTKSDKVALVQMDISASSSPTTEASKTRHRQALRRRQLIDQPTGFGGGASMDGGGIGGSGVDIMRKGPPPLTSQLNARDAELRDVLGFNIQPQHNNKQRTRARGIDLASSNMDEMDVATRARFHRKSRQKQGEVKKINRVGVNDFTSSEEGETDDDVDPRQSPVREWGTAMQATLRASKPESPRQARKKALKEDVELTIRHYRPEHRPDERGARGSQRPFAGIRPTAINSDEFIGAPKSTKAGGGGYTIGGLMSFGASVYAILFCVKIKGCLGHETKHEIQKVFNKESAEGKAKRLKALQQVVELIDEPNPNAKDPKLANSSRVSYSTAALVANGGFITPRNVGAKPSSILPDVLPRIMQSKKESPVGESLSNAGTPHSSPLTTPRITARGAMLAGRQQFAELKKVMSDAVRASSQRMLHAKKQHCTALISRAVYGLTEEPAEGGCSGHHHHHHHHHHSPKHNHTTSGSDSKEGFNLANPFSSTTIPGIKGHDHCKPDQPTKKPVESAQLSEFLFDTASARAAITDLTHLLQSTGPSGLAPSSHQTRNSLQPKSYSKASISSLSAPSQSAVAVPGAGGTVVGQRNFYILHNGWKDYPFTPPVLVQAAVYVPQAKESKLRTFTRPDSPLLPVIEKMEVSKSGTVKGNFAASSKAPVGILRKDKEEQTLPRSQSRSMLSASVGLAGCLTAASLRQHNTLTPQSPPHALALVTPLNLQVLEDRKTFFNLPSPPKETKGVGFRHMSVSHPKEPMASSSPLSAREPARAKLFDAKERYPNSARIKQALGAKSHFNKDDNSNNPPPISTFAPLSPTFQRSRSNSLASNNNYLHPTASFINSSSRSHTHGRDGTLANKRGSLGGSSARSGTTAMSLHWQGGTGFEDLAARRPNGKSQIESQREMIKEHKKKRATFVDHKTNLHIQWRKETVAERLAKDYDYSSGAPATYDTFHTAKIIDHNTFLQRATEEMKRVLQVREEVSFPIKARKLVEAVENIEKSRKKLIKERLQQKKIQSTGSDADGEEEVTAFDISSPISAPTPKRQGFSVALEPPEEVLRTINPSVSVTSAIRTVEAMISDEMRHSQLEAIKVYNSQWVDAVRGGILPYVDEGGFTAEEEKVFHVFKNYLANGGGVVGAKDHKVGKSVPSPSPRQAHSEAQPLKKDASLPRRPSNTGSLPTIGSSTNLKRMANMDPHDLNLKILRKVLQNNFTTLELEIPNVQFLMMRMLPLFAGLKQEDLEGILRERRVPYHLVTREFEEIFSTYVADADDAHRKLRERRIDRHLAFHNNVSRRLDKAERLVRAEKGIQ